MDDRFRLMVESVKDYAIYMLDPSGVVTSWNEGARRLKGYEAPEIIGQSYARFFTPEDVAAQLPQTELDVARTEGRFEAEGWRVRRDGSRFWANVVLTRVTDARGNHIGFAKVTRDLTERRRSELELERAERRARLMVSGVKDYAIFMLDPSGHVASWNEGAHRLKGYTEQEILGRHFSVFYPEVDQVSGKTERELETALATGRVEDEGWRVRKDGTQFWANVVITRVDDPEGGVLGFTKVTRDLTERKRAEEALRAANELLETRVRERTRELEHALRARDEFLSIASHELKTPLTGLKLQLQLSRRTLVNNELPKLVDAIDKSLRQTTTLEDLIEDLLDVSRVQTGRFELVVEDLDVAALIDDTTQRMALQLEYAEMPLTLDVDRTLTARWDRRRVSQVLMNLLTNAVKYAPGSPLEVKVAADGERVRIDVVDHGPGIAPDKQAVVFDRYERAGASPNAGGLGLGLYISRRIVEGHGGTLELVSAPGQGARFVARLPKIAAT
ncbi:MAG: PAS domain-containing sensor histidine kinase [Myxococcaceae bacterium]|nr:PAS domain-containing sensor histidine kinase [Myxococcaceae bacterium]